MRQFALTTVADRERLFDVNEVVALDHHFNAIGDAARPDDRECAAWPLCLMYGAFLPQPCSSRYAMLDALGELYPAVPRWHGWVKRDACYVLGVCAIKTYAALEGCIPVAILVQASKDTFTLMDAVAPQAVSAFVRYANLSVTENLHERPGILAIKGKEKKHKTDVLTLYNWTQSIDDARARRVATRLR